MNTTAGICSTRARYFASMFNKGASSGASFDSTLFAKSRLVLEINDCCCRKTSASSCSALSASNRLLPGPPAAIVCTSSRLQVACERESGAIFHLLHYRRVAHKNRFPFLLVALPHQTRSVLPTTPPGRFLIQ